MDYIDEYMDSRWIDETTMDDGWNETKKRKSILFERAGQMRNVGFMDCSIV